MGHVLIVGNRACFRKALGIMLGRETDFGANTQAESMDQARACLSGRGAEGINAAIIHLGLLDGDGRDLIPEIVQRRIPAMVLTESRDREVHDRLRELGAKEVLDTTATLEEIFAAVRRLQGKVKPMHPDQLVREMVYSVLSRQAMASAGRTGESFERAMVAVLQTESGRQLEELRLGPHGAERADLWQEGLAPGRDKERRRDRREERNRAVEDAAWTLFIQAEMRELDLRKDGQLAALLGDPLPGELPETLARLGSQDQRQAEEGLVALMSGGEVSYKHLDDLTREDRPARIAANRLRTAWLKEKQERWLCHVDERL
jgi:DNA-binding NarL/FixJ family response regulator